MNNPLLELLRRVPGLQQLLLLVGLAAAVGGGIAAYMWLRGPTYTTAFVGLSAADAVPVTQALGQAGIPYRLNAAGDVQVPADQLVDARMRLGAKGLPASRNGMDSLSRHSGFGVSQFMEHARYNYALESDLANTIGTLHGVSRAFVHLAVPKPSAFISDQGHPSASVMVQLTPGVHLGPTQVSAIVHLVASSVPDLDAARVTVVDGAGQLLSDNATNSDIGRTSRQMQLTRNFEQNIDSKVASLLAPIVGRDRVRVQTQADMDFSLAEQASETYHPDPEAIRSENITSNSGSGALAQGVPGAFSNKPKTPAKTPAGTQPVAPAPASSSANPAVAAVTATRSTSRQYAIGRSITHVARKQGRLQRLSVAVLIDDRPQTGADGKTVGTPLTTQQLQSIQSLVQSAVGYDKARGDVVTVVNTRFLDAPAPTLPPVTPAPWWKQDWVIDLARNGLAVIALLLVGFGVIRPALRSLLGGGNGPPPALATDEQAALAGGSTTHALAGPSATRSYEDKVKMAREAVAQDPKRVAQVVRSWVSKDG